MMPQGRDSRVQFVMKIRLLFALALTAAGCASLGRQAFRTPTVELKDVQLRAIGLDGGALDLLLAVNNPNEFRMDATRLTYTLIADTSFLAAGAITKRVTLKARENSDITLPLTFTMKELLGAAEVILRKGRVNYTVKGEVTVDTPFGSQTRPYEGKATLETGSLIRP
jgi:LEA14-like dessication related protein